MKWGTDSQHEYLQALTKKLGYADIAEAVRAHAEGMVIEPGSEPTKQQASAAIAALKIAEGTLPPEGQAKKRAASGDRSKSKFLTARVLRRIAQGEVAPPEELDDDARWVLERLELINRIQALSGNAPAGAETPRRPTGPIPMSVLVDYFKTWDALADAFGVTVPTAKAWGAHLPASKAHKAEVLTNGFVKAPATA
jgi:hypothetical protein